MWGYGILSNASDGMDAIAVYSATSESVKRPDAERAPAHGLLAPLIKSIYHPKWLMQSIDPLIVSKSNLSMNCWIESGNSVDERSRSEKSIKGNFIQFKDQSATQTAISDQLIKVGGSASSAAMRALSSRISFSLVWDPWNLAVSFENSRDGSRIHLSAAPGRKDVFVTVCFKPAMEKPLQTIDSRDVD